PVDRVRYPDAGSVKSDTEGILIGRYGGDQGPVYGTDFGDEITRLAGDPHMDAVERDGGRVDARPVSTNYCPIASPNLHHVSTESVDHPDIRSVESLAGWTRAHSHRIDERTVRFLELCHRVGGRIGHPYVCSVKCDSPGSGSDR